MLSIQRHPETVGTGAATMFVVPSGKRPLDGELYALIPGKASATDEIFENSQKTDPIVAASGRGWPEFAPESRLVRFSEPL